MAITPNQYQYVGPFEKIITSNAINKQFSTFTLANKAIIKDCFLQIANSTTLKITSGVIIIDKVVVQFPTDVLINLVNTDFSTNAENVVYAHFEYNLELPLNKCEINVKEKNSISYSSDQNVIFGFVQIDNTGNIVSVSSVDSSSTYTRDEDPRYWKMFLYNMFDPEFYPRVSVTAYINGQFIKNVPDPVEDYDIANKRYVDNAISTVPVDELVKVDSNEGDSSYFGGVNKGQYLNEQLYPGENININLDTSTGYHKLIISKVDEKTKVISGDSVWRFDNANNS